MGGLIQSLAGKPDSPSDSLSIKFDDPHPNFWDQETIPEQSTTKQYPNQSSTNKYQDALQDVAQTYPALAPHTKKALVYDAVPPKETDSQLETYLPWEDWNPHPGKITSELYRPYSSREQLRDAIAGDLIHY